MSVTLRAHYLNVRAELLLYGASLPNPRVGAVAQLEPWGRTFVNQLVSSR